ncbi:MAG: hypothetical protein K9M02_18640 [Thiohalocapsa sp.]|nr:hypothetical protein [Thiohalocapsa sp.]
MNLSKSLLAATLIAAGAVTAHSAVADVYCPKNLGAVTIDDDVIVDNGLCRMEGTTVKGNIKIYSGGALVARNVEVDGNVQADGGRFVRVIRSDVGGDIQLEGVHGDVSRVARSTVGGNVQYDSNSSRLVTIYSTIDGDLQAFSNTGGVVIRYNTIDGNLQCKSNRPRPIGGFNRVSGNKEDQCRNL